MVKARRDWIKGNVTAPVNERGDTALHVAAQNNDTTALRGLLEGGADPNARNRHDYTALHMAYDADCIAALIEFGADPLLLNNNGQTPLGRFIDYEYDVPAQAVIQCAGPHLLNAPINSMGYTPLHMTATRKNVELTAWLVERGANVNAVDDMKRTPLAVAIETGQKRIITCLAENGADLNKTAVPSLEALVGSGAADEAMLTLLLKLGADPLLDADLSGRLLCKTLKENRLGLFIELVKAGADINGRDANGRTPLTLAVQGGIPGHVEYILDNGADANRLTDDGKVPLFFVRNNRANARIVELLSGAGADMHWADAEGNTVLHVIDNMTADETIAALVKHGANVETKNDKGMTPLHCAAVRGDVTAVNHLRKHGASLFTGDNDGMTPADLAHEYGHVALANILKAKEDELRIDTVQCADGTLVRPRHGQFKSRGGSP